MQHNESFGFRWGIKVMRKKSAVEIGGTGGQVAPPPQDFGRNWNKTLLFLVAPRPPQIQRASYGPEEELVLFGSVHFVGGAFHCR